MDTIDEDGSTSASAELAPSTAAERKLVAGVHARLFPGLALPSTPVTPGELAASEGGELEPRRLGRYLVVRKLGAGGMGVVFLCHDEQLDRQLAVKLLRTRYQSPSARLRLEREAQALARLSHPNVVQIYELGEHEGGLFVAMEYVVGETLRAWLGAAAGRSWVEIAAALREAGAGLAAAHAAGLVHRDFKPDNVIVGADGRTRVLDFGLARQAAGERGDADGGSPRASATTLAELTQAGARMGTPAYMAPEQFAGLPCDAACDQFGFCVVAYQALFGRRPFASETFADLAAAVREGSPAPIPDDSPVPRRLRAAILRGLATNPADRWPSMAALLAEFERALGHDRRPRRLAWAFATAALVAATAAFMRDGGQAPRLCELDEAALAGTWDGEDRRAVATAFAERERGEAFVQVVEATLDGWTQAWLASARRACEATQVRGTSSAAMLDLRSSCLERQRREADAIVELLARPGARVELLDELPDVSVCEDPRLAETSHPLPDDPAARERVLAAYGQLERARASARMAAIDEADAIVEALAAEVAALEHLPLTIEVEALTAERQLWRGRTADAVPLLRAAIRRAEAARLDELVASLRITLAIHVVGRWGPVDVQALVLDEAEDALARIGRGDDRRRLELALARADWADQSDDHEAARAGYEAVVAATDELPGLRGRAQRLLALHLLRRGELDDAERAFAAARASSAAAYGPAPWIDADLEAHRGLLALERGEFEGATAAFTRARELAGPALLDDRDLASLLALGEGKLALVRGELDLASAKFERVTEQARLAVRAADAWEALGALRFYRGDYPGSLAAYERARPLMLAARGPEHSRVGLLHSNIGESLAAAGDRDAALAEFSLALDLLGRVLPPDHADLALPYKGRGQVRLALGQAAAGIGDLERSLAIHAANPGEPIERADVEFSLARALFERGEPDRARTLARAAAGRLTALGQAEMAAAIETWIRDHD